MTGPRTAKQIAARIEEEIRAGRRPPGARLPTQPELAAFYQVSRMTAARAYNLLHERGLTRGTPGSGTFVRDRRSWQDTTTSKPS
jgi:DNA-binding GntR family transcriptional regulator